MRELLIGATMIVFFGCLQTGCRTTRLDSAFVDVQNEINQRLELQSNEPASFAERGSAEDTVAKLLKNGHLTPDSAVVIGLVNNPELKSSFQNLGIVHADLIKARSLHNPKIEIMARDSDEEDTDTHLEFTIVQDVLSLLLQRSRVNLSKIEMERLKLNLTEEAMNLAVAIRKKVFAFQAESAKTEILRKIYESRQAASELALRQHEAGNINDLELAIQQTAHQQIKLAMSRQELATQSARNQLNLALGLWGEQTTWQLVANLPLPPQKTFSFDGLESTAIKNSLRLSALRLEDQSIQQRLSLSRNVRMTDLEVGFNTEKEPEGERLTGGLVEFGLPVFDRNQGDIAKFKALLRQNARRTESIAIGIRTRVTFLTHRLRVLRGQLDYYSNSVMPLRSRVVDLSQRHYNAMFIGTYELLQAKQNELSAEMDYLNTLRDYWQTFHDLKHLEAGGISTASSADLRSTFVVPTNGRHHD